MSKSRSQVEESIINELRKASEELHTEEIAARVNLTRHTVSKYLQVLNAKGSVRLRQVGNAKLWQESTTEVIIRPLQLEDLDQMIHIEKVLQKQWREEMPNRSERALKSELNIFKKTMEHHLQFTDATLRLGAELEGVLVGYIIGEIRLWEFGVGDEVGWINVMAVDPNYQQRGIGHQLGQSLLDNMKAQGVQRIRTLTDSYSGEMIAFFRSLGFRIITMLPMEKRLDSNGKE